MIKKIIGLSFLLISLSTLAQRTNNSPYSIFGIGDNSSSKTIEEIGMGQIGGAFNSTYLLNFTNPAALAHLRFTSYNLAGQNKAISIDDGTNTASSSNASFSYLALGFPIGEKAGLSFGLKPYTSVGYSLTQNITDATTGELATINSFTGEGGTNSLFVGVGHKIGKNFSIGLEGAYIFGSIENSLLNRRANVPLATIEKTDSDVRSLQIKSGIQYVGKINEKLTLKTGIAVRFKNELSDKGRRYRYSLLNLPDVISPRDTTVNVAFDNTLTIPTETVFSTGIGQENKWYAGVEYAFQDAISFDDQISQNNNAFSYTKSNRISVGGFYTPKINSISSYWQRVTYRAGFKFEELGLLVRNTSIKDFGMSFGVGLPIGKNSPTNVNIGFELGQRGQTNNQLIKENYLNFRVGFSLTDIWFRKQKIN